MNLWGRKYKRQKKETKEVEMEFRPGKGVLKREKFPNTRKHSHCQVCGELLCRLVRLRGLVILF